MRTMRGLLVGLFAILLVSLHWTNSRAQIPQRIEGRALGGLAQQIQRVQGGSITVSPNVVDTGTSSMVTISASGFFDLSEVLEPQIGIRPSQGVSNVQIESATAQHLVLSFQLARSTIPGTRTLFIKDSHGTTVVALDLILKRGAFCEPDCQAPLVCRDNVCVSPPPSPPPFGCHPPCEDGLVCRGNRCIQLQCRPACRPTQICENGRCVIAK